MTCQHAGDVPMQSITGGALQSGLGPQVCPTCNTCPTCGRGGVLPYFPYIPYPSQPYYLPPQWVCDNDIKGAEITC